MAFVNFGSEGLAEQLRQANKVLQWRRGDSYVLLPVEQFGTEVLCVIRSVREFSQLDLDGRLMVPSRLRMHLLHALLQALPVAQLNESLLEQRLQLDLGL